MSQPTRRRFSPEEKVQILRRHLLDRVPVSDLCEEVGLHPNQFYLCQKQFFERGVAACAPDKPDPAESSGRKRSKRSKPGWRARMPSLPRSARSTFS